MTDFNLHGLADRSFEQLIQSLALKVIGPNVWSTEMVQMAVERPPLTGRFLILLRRIDGKDME